VALQASIPLHLRTEESLIPAKYTCDGSDTSPPVRWRAMPAGTAEVALFAANVKPVDGKLFFDWAVVGLKAQSHGVKEGVLPPGAVVGRNSAGKVGYSFCPARGPLPEHMIVRIVALGHRLAAKSGFDAATLYQAAEKDTKGVALTGAGYLRR
jgi:hypothetical protein